MSYIDEIDFSKVDVDVDEDGKMFITEDTSNIDADLEADLMDEDERWNSAGVEISYKDIEINGC
tara:strand:+ start:656 stop:847 length:192 start_codon:yes stop_codon:yes gene_type:complete